MADAFRILPERLRVSAAKCYFGKESGQDGLFTSRLPDREGKRFTGDKRWEEEGIRMCDHHRASQHLCVLMPES